MLKILHTADIHLDSPFSRLDPSKAEIRRNELRAAFTSMMTWVRVNNIDIVLIAGDLFDSEFVTRETVGIIVREFERCRAEVFIAAGNHDFISESSVYAKEGIFPENVHIFKSDALERISLDSLGVDVYGYSFNDAYMYENPFASKKVENPERLNLLVAHGDMRSADSKYCPVTKEDILSFGADYTALGHIHNAGEISSADGVYYAYSGCLEGRDFGETGVKGAILVEAEKNGGALTLSAKRIPFSKRRYECAELHVDGAESESEISEMIDSFISERGYGEETLLSLTLRGEVPPSLVINTDHLCRKRGLFFFELSDGTLPSKDASGLAADITVRGQFYRELLPMLESGSEEERRLAESALRYGLSALEGENIIDFEL